jgi:hypothetical protein
MKLEELQAIERRLLAKYESGSAASPDEIVRLDKEIKNVRRLIKECMSQ